MGRSLVDRETLIEFLTRLSAALKQPAHVFLIGATSQLFEGWRDHTPRVEFTAQVAREDWMAFQDQVQAIRSEMEIALSEEAPGDMIPLPTACEQRARPAGKGQFGQMHLYHFDPYSVAFRLIARGDEPDYDAVLTFLQHGWINVDEMNTLLTDLLPHFTSETLQQDPAEFRRKFRGLLQMWRAVQVRQ